MATQYVVIGKTGRIPIPEHVRKKLCLKSGIALRIRVRGNRVTLENPFLFDQGDARNTKRMQEICRDITMGKVKHVPSPQYLRKISRRPGGLSWRLVIPKRSKRRGGTRHASAN